MKKLLLVSLLIFTSRIFASEISYTLSGSMGLRTGCEDEFVFYKVNGSDEKLSELNWEQSPLFVAKIENKVSFGKWNFFADLTAGIPGCTGLIKDSDWKNVKFGSTHKNLYDIKTNYSESRNVSLMNFEGELGAGYQVNLKYFSVTPRISTSVIVSKNEAIDGWKMYSSPRKINGNISYYPSYDSEGVNKEYFEDSYGPDTVLLELSRFSVWTWVGADIKYNPIKRLTLNLSVNMSPFVFIKSIDQHKLTSVDYLDEISEWTGAARFKAGIEFAFSPNNRIFLDSTFHATRLLKGISGEKNSSGSSYTKTQAISGFSLNYIQLNLGYRHRFCKSLF